MAHCSARSPSAGTLACSSTLPLRSAYSDCSSAAAGHSVPSSSPAAQQNTRYLSHVSHSVVKTGYVQACSDRSSVQYALLCMVRKACAASACTEVGKSASVACAGRAAPPADSMQASRAAGRLRWDELQPTTPQRPWANHLHVEDLRRPRDRTCERPGGSVSCRWAPLARPARPTGAPGRQGPSSVVVAASCASRDAAALPLLASCARAQGASGDAPCWVCSKPPLLCARDKVQTYALSRRWNGRTEGMQAIEQHQWKTEQESH
jgi:hypothetical protein